MEFVYKNGSINIDSEKKTIILKDQSIDLDGLVIEIPGEYEKSGMLMYAFARNEEKLFHFRAEGYWIAYIPYPLADISSEALDFLGTVDILVLPGSKAIQTVIEKIEPRLLITYGPSASEVATTLGMTEMLPKYRVKDTDLSSEKTGCILLGE
jgi:hypothetical protein